MASNYEVQNPDPRYSETNISIQPEGFGILSAANQPVMSPFEMFKAARDARSRSMEPAPCINHIHLIDGELVFTTPVWPDVQMND